MVLSLATSTQQYNIPMLPVTEDLANISKRMPEGKSPKAHNNAMGGKNL